MLLGVAGLTGGLAVGGATLVAALNVALLRTADAEALTTADAIVRLIDDDALSDPLPLAGRDVRVQVVDAEGRVRAVSINADRLVPMLYPDELAALPDRHGMVIAGERIGV